MRKENLVYTVLIFLFYNTILFVPVIYSQSNDGNGGDRRKDLVEIRVSIIFIILIRSIIVKKRKFSLLPIILVLFLSLTIIGCGKKEDQKTIESLGTTTESENTETKLATIRYSDPNKYFKIVPPAGWRILKYPEDPRGKVAFIGPADFELRILAKGLEYNSFEEMMEELKGIERGIGVNTNIEKIVFTDIPAVKRVFIFKGLKMLFIDFMIGNTSHNLMYSSSPKNFEKHLSLAWGSINTYEPTLRGVSAEDVKKHSIARSFRLSTIFFEQGNYDLALELINEGLDVEPNNAELLELKKNVTNKGIQNGNQ